MERSIKYGGIDKKVHGDVNLFQASFYGEFGLNNIFCYKLRIQPFIGFQTGYYQLGTSKEHGTQLFDLKIKENSDCLTTSLVGLHFFNFLNDDCSWGISGDIVWKHLFEYDKHLENKFIRFGDEFKIYGHQSDVNGLEGTLTYFQRISNRWLVNAEISAEKWANYANFYMSVGCSYSW
jgi:hypothetical protein